MELTLSYNNLPSLNRREPEHKVRLVDFIKAYINNNIMSKKSWTDSYNLVCRKIEQFEMYHSDILYTHNASGNCLRQFVDFLQNQNLRPGYILGIISKTKSMIRLAAEYGFQIDPSYSKVIVPDEVPHTIALTIGEIAIIYKCKNLTKLQDEIKDIFIFGCVVGQRYSDYSIMSIKNANGPDSFQIRQKKTGKVVDTPAGEIAHEILSKYGGKLPKTRSIQQFNKQIKLICKKAGITKEVTISKTVGKEYISQKYEKWQLVSSHTARRTFATFMNQSGKCTIDELQLLLGHSNINTTIRYVKRDQSSIARRASHLNILNTF